MAPGQRKLRDSCDACHIAKVKCIKTKTGECLRCVSSSSVCSFSPSDRRGKPRGAKNKCNRVPQPNSVQQQQTPTKSIPAPPPPPPPVVTGQEDHHASPNYDLDRYFSTPTAATVTQQDFINDAWTLSSPEEPHHIDFSPQEEALATMLQNDWMQVDNTPMLTADPQLLHQGPTLASGYPDPMLTSPHPFPPLQTFREPDAFDAFTPSPQPGKCKCYPINLSSLYSMHSQALSASNGCTTPFDVALFINNKAIERCHSMLNCSECVLNPDKEKSSTNMLMLAGAMDDILMSYGQTCAAYIDGTAHDPLVFSSNGAGSPISGTSPKMETSGLSSRTQSISSMASSSSMTSMSVGTPATQLSLGTYRVEGEDGRHLKLEILKIELRKVERLWTVFRDTCALQKFEDEQKSLYAALVCYLAKKLRRTAEMLESRRRVSSVSW